MIVKLTTPVVGMLATIGLASALVVSGCSAPSSPAPSSSAAAVSTASVSPAAAIASAHSSASAPQTTQASLVKIPARTAPVPAPGGGNISQTVKPSPVRIAPAVPLTGTAQFGGGISASITKATRINAVAHLAGEVSGPAVAVTLSIRNDSAKSADLSQVVVTVADHDGLPASPISANASKPLAGSLAAGQSASGVYVFSLPAKAKDPISISVTFATTAPVVLFVGASK